MNKASIVPKALLILAALWVGISTKAANQNYDFEENGIYYNILSEAEKTCEVTMHAKMFGYEGEITVPATANGYTVTAIGELAFSRSNASRVYLPNTITTIKQFGFSYSPLEQISIPASVTTIENGAFGSCTRLVSVIFEPGDTPIRLGTEGDYDGLFSKCTSLIALTISRPLDYKIEYRNDGKLRVHPPFEGLTSLKSVVYRGQTEQTIGERMFSGCTGLTSVDLGNQVKSIGQYAFENCSALTSLCIPACVDSIQGNAFVGCTGVKDLKIEDDTSVLTLNEYGVGTTIEDMPLETVYIGDRLIDAFYSSCANKTALHEATVNCKTATDFAIFANCTALTSVTLTDNVEELGHIAFSGCTALTSINLPASLSVIGDKTFKGCTALTSINIPASLSTIDQDAFSDCTALKEVHTSDLSAWCRINFKNAKANPLYCARYLYVNGEMVNYDLTIPSDISELKNFTFSGMDLTEVNIPATLNRLGSAFDLCDNLVEMNVEDSATPMEYLYLPLNVQTFYMGRDIKSLETPNYNELRTFTIGDMVTEIGKSWFGLSRNLEEVTIGRGVTKIKEGAFGGLINRINIKDLGAWCNIDFEDLNSVPNGPLYLNGSRVQHVDIPEGSTEVKPYIFYNKEILSLTLPSTITAIGQYAFYGCDLTSVTFPDGLSTIGEYAFTDCPLSELTIPASVMQISNAFSNENLRTIRIEDSDQPLQWGGGYYTLSQASTLHLGRDIEDSYYYSGSYKELSNLTFGTGVTAIPNSMFDGTCIKTVTIPSNVKTIGSSAFADNDYLTSVTMDGVQNVDEKAFFRCPALTSVTMNDNLQSLGQSAFAECTALPAIALPAGLTRLGENAFEGCTALASVAFPDGLAEIGAYAFNGCTALASATLPDGLTLLGENAFEGCTDLASVTFPDGLAEIGAYAFNGCSALASATLPDGLTLLGENAFENCTALTSVTFPDGLEEIGAYAFANCQSLTDVDLPDMLKRINEAAFNGCQSLTNIDLPAHLGFILEDAFTLCGSLESIRSWASTPPWPGDCFDSETYDQATLYTPNGSLEEYKRYQIWSRFDNIVEFDPTGIADGTATPGGLSLWADGGTLHVDGLPQGTPVEVYTTDGKLVYQGTATDVALPEGNLYIVRAAGQTSKIIL